MKDVINDVEYDTDNAVKVGTWNNGRGKNDPRFEQVTLYHDKEYRYFFLQEGGANSGYAKMKGRGWVYGRFIRPVDKPHMREWAAKYLHAYIN